MCESVCWLLACSLAAFLDFRMRKVKTEGDQRSPAFQICVKRLPSEPSDGYHRPWSTSTVKN